MPFIAPAIGAVVAAVTTGVGAVSAFVGSLGIAGSFLVSGALSIGASLLSRSLAKKPGKPGDEGPKGTELNLSTDPASPRQLILGTRAIAGRLVYWCIAGSNREFLHLVIALADHRINRVKRIAVDGKWVGWTMAAGDDEHVQNIAEYTNDGIPNMRVWIRSGLDDQDAFDEVVGASDGQWTLNHRLRGCAVAYVRLRWDKDVWRGGGLPSFLFECEGALLYDPRKDSTSPGGAGAHRWGQPATYEWTDNLEVCRYNYLRGIAWHEERPRFGPGLEAADIDLALALAAMNVCDETVAKIGGSEARYRCNAVISAEERYSSVLEKFSTACAGSLPDLSGRYAMLPGVPQVPVIAFTDDDLIAGAELTGSRHRSIGEVVNEVTGNWADPSSLYQRVALPARWSSADEELDGGFRRSEAYELDYVASQTQGQRVLEIFRRLGRRQRTHRLTLRRRFAVLEAGDWVTWTSQVFGYSALVFRVEQITLNPDWTVTCELREIDDEVYDWDALTDEIDAANPGDLPSAGPDLDTVDDFAVTIVTVVSDDGTQQPGIRCTWDPITDPTVTGLRIDYRRIGDTPFLTYFTSREQAVAGAATIVAGVIGGSFYEARATLITEPPRVIITSGLVASPTASTQIIVKRAQVSTITEAVLPSVITVDNLAPALRRAAIPGFRGAELDDTLLSALMARAIEQQQRRDILLAAAGALRARIEQVRTVLVTETEALAQIVDALSAVIEDPVTGIEALATALTSLTTQVTDLDGDLTALSALVTNLQTQVGNNSANGRVRFVVLSTASGAIASYGIDLETNVAGVFRRASFQIDVTASGSKVKIVGDTFEVLASAFRIYHPSYAGGTPVQVLDLSGGVLTLNANLAVNGNAVITGTLTAPAIASSARSQTIRAVNNSASISSNGGKIAIVGWVEWNSSSGVSSAPQTKTFTLRRNGVTLLTRTFNLSVTAVNVANGAASFGGSIGFDFTDQPGAGSYTYEITQNDGSPLSLVATSSFTLIENVI